MGWKRREQSGTEHRVKQNRMEQSGIKLGKAEQKLIEQICKEWNRIEVRENE